MFDWKPLTPGHEHLEFDFQSRDVDFYETLTVETRGTMFLFPHFYAKVTNRRQAMAG